MAPAVVLAAVLGAAVVPGEVGLVAQVVGAAAEVQVAMEMAVAGMQVMATVVATPVAGWEVARLGEAGRGTAMEDQALVALVAATEVDSAVKALLEAAEMEEA